MNFALRVYRRLARAFPHEFQVVYGTEVMQLGEDAVEEIGRQYGAAGLIRLSPRLTTTSSSIERRGAFSLITGFLVMGFNKTNSVQAKFDASTMVLLSIDPVRDGYSAGKAQALFEKLLERLKAIASVRGVAFAAQPPFSISSATVQMTTGQSTAGSQAAKSQVVKKLVKETVGTGYFSALSEPMLAGRQFEERDERTETPMPVVLNESAAHAPFWKGGCGRPARHRREQAISGSGRGSRLEERNPG